MTVEEADAIKVQLERMLVRVRAAKEILGTAQDCSQFVDVVHLGDLLEIFNVGHAFALCKARVE